MENIFKGTQFIKKYLSCFDRLFYQLLEYWFWYYSSNHFFRSKHLKTSNSFRRSEITIKDFHFSVVFWRRNIVWAKKGQATIHLSHREPISSSYNKKNTEKLPKLLRSRLSYDLFQANNVLNRKQNKMTNDDQDKMIMYFDLSSLQYDKRGHTSST